MESTKITPWKIYKTCKTGFTRQPVLSLLTLQDGSATTSEKETATALLHKFFPDDSTKQDSEQHRNIRAQISKLGPPDSLIEPTFMKHEVDKVLRSLDKKKCPGPDGIDGAIVKQLHKSLSALWIMLFNKCLLLGFFPKEWKKARVIDIPKSDKTKLRSVQGYCGISLLSIPGKCLQKLVIERLNYFFVSKGQIPPQQYGVMAGSPLRTP